MSDARALEDVRVAYGEEDVLALLHGDAHDVGHGLHPELLHGLAVLLLGAVLFGAATIAAAGRGRWLAGGGASSWSSRVGMPTDDPDELSSSLSSSAATFAAMAPAALYYALSLSVERIRAAPSLTLPVRWKRLAGVAANRSRVAQAPASRRYFIDSRRDGFLSILFSFP